MLRGRRLRERESVLQEEEMDRYYQPWLAAHGSAANVASNVASIAARDLHDTGYQPRPSKDKALLAFAQLAALRLNVRRAMVSLIGSEHQYILTEATRTMSLISGSRHGTDDELWLGNTVLNRKDAVCGTCFDSQCEATDAEGKTFKARGLIVNDLRLDDRFKDRPYVVSEPGVRFYAGVPIITRSGHAIGTYAVSDENPRDGLSVSELEFMQDVSTAIMEHLEWARDRVDRYKAERIVRGLTDFIYQSSSPSEDRTEIVDDDKLEDSTASASDRSREEVSPTKVPGKTSMSLPLRPPPRRKDSSDDSGSSIGSKTSTRSTRHTQATALRKRQSQPSSLTTVLGRAARILQRSTLADGVVFFGSTAEAPIGHIHGSPSSENKACKVLGISLRNRPETTFLKKQNLPLLALEKYIRAYPGGKSLYFSNSGQGLDSGEDTASDGPDAAERHLNPDRARSTTNRAAREKRKPRMSHAELLELMPGVKNLIFLPLFDPINLRWVAGGFLWTAQTGRMMSSLDQAFPYLKAFGNAIVSEVARVDSVKVDKAKTLFISSMSHELRSPLHGILGSVEFLAETAVDSYQSSLLQSISNCGKTLLDTLSSLLTYTKISSVDKTEANADIDLAVIVEEVVEAVCAGHTFKKLHNKIFESKHVTLAAEFQHEARQTARALHDTRSDDDSQGTVTVLLEIAHRDNWVVKARPGALRRIVMNLVGNALKYTANGYVSIRLTAEQTEKDSSEVAVSFEVQDTGRGMSEEFQRNHMFTPFQQENSFAPGTGLGLSIVKQLTDHLDGSLVVDSTQDKGTKIRAAFTFEQGPGASDYLEEDISHTIRQTRGLSLSFLDPNGEKQEPEKANVALLDQNIGKTCSEWFEMKVSTADNIGHLEGAILMYTEPPSLEYLLEHHGEDSGAHKNSFIPLVIICMNWEEAVSISSNHAKALSELGAIVEVVAQPCGPRKMTKVFDHCMRKAKEVRQAHDKAKANTAKGEKEEEPNLDGSNESKTAELAAVQSVMEFPIPSPARMNSPPPSFILDAPSTKALSKTPDPAATDPPDDALHVLLVDDNKINVDLLVKFMRKHRMSYDVAYDGQDALDKYKASCAGAGKDAKRFDWVLMDIQMPIMGGFEATRAIRAFEEAEGLQRTTVAALTAYASDEARREATESGADLFLAKPIKFAKLKELLLSSAK